MAFISRHAYFLIFNINDDKSAPKGGEIVAHRILNVQVDGGSWKQGEVRRSLLGELWTRYRKALSKKKKSSSFTKWRIRQ